MNGSVGDCKGLKEKFRKIQQTLIEYSSGIEGVRGMGEVRTVWRTLVV